MSPKKGIKNPITKRNTADKVTKRTIKKEKLKSCLPANITVSIPLTKGAEDGLLTPIVKGRRPPLFKKHLDLETKVDLANAVASHQLAKEVPIVTTCNNSLSSSEPNNVEIKGRKRGRQKQKVVSDFFQNRVVVNNTTEDSNRRERIKMTRRGNKKSYSNQTDADSENTVTTRATKLTEMKAPDKKPARRFDGQKRSADSTENEVVKRRRTKKDVEELNVEIKLEDIQKNNKTVPNQNAGKTKCTTEPEEAVKQSEPASLLTPRKRKPSTKRPPSTAKKPPSTVKMPLSTAKMPLSTAKMPPTMAKRPPAAKQSGKKRRPKGKRDNEDITSPSILEQLKKSHKKESDLKFNTPGPVDSRKTSVSSNSNLSWTKDISSSSATTCITVSSNDFVRFNKKLPVLKLTNIDGELKKRQRNVPEVTTSANNNSDNLSDTSDSASTERERKFSETLNDPVDVNSLQLSSPPSTRCSQTYVNPLCAKASEKLDLLVKAVDLEIINWFSSDIEDIKDNLAKFKGRLFCLDNEFDTIRDSRAMKQILEPPSLDDIGDSFVPDPVKTNVSNEIENPPVEEVPKEVEFVKPVVCRKLSNKSDGNTSNASRISTRDDSSEDEAPEGATKHSSYYDYHDDDDALSLFAESITGFESSRVNTSIASAPLSVPRQVEEYVPKPVKEDFASHIEKPTYLPSKIREDAEIIASKIKTICEKQNADSTSIYKQSNSTDDAESYQDFNENTDFGTLDTRIGPPEIIKRPRLMDSLFVGTPKARSVVFGNLCFYNLMNCCRKMFFGQCRFLHMIPTAQQVKEKLILLDERMLIQEYLLLRNWAELRRRYGMCYVEEMAKRGLTRILVEIAFDFIAKARHDSEEDTRLRVNTIEATLLHLNTVELSVCEDLLKLSIPSDKVNRTLLCDVFMATMSITQNFSRFKSVFLNLTYFMVDNDRTFNKDVVEHILERVCILPFEESVARALIQMMRLTNSEIFNNSMIGHFEKQISVNKDVFEEFCLLKNQCALSSLLASSVVAASPPPDVEQAGPKPAGSDGQPPAASPDTTNLDNMNKTLEEPAKPVITRTIGMNPPIVFNLSSPVAGPRTHTNSGSSSDDNSQVNIRKWRNRAIFPHLRPPPHPDVRPLMRPPVRTPLRPPRPHMRPQRPFNQRLVTFKSPNYIGRHPGPKY